MQVCGVLAGDAEYILHDEDGAARAQTLEELRGDDLKRPSAWRLEV